jgi:hypothetical protein
MSLSTTFDHDLRRGFATYVGTVNYHWLQEFMVEVVRHGAQEYPKLINGLDAELRLAPEEINQFLEFAQALGRQWRFGPVAVVVADELSYAEVHTLGLLTEEICHVQPFWRVEEAEQWLAQSQGFATTPLER